MCCYNGERYLREALDSIVGQTYKDWELVIINDGSSDSTESIIKEYMDRGYPIVYHYQENHGLGYSRNEALKRSKGEYVAFIDQDDIWMPEKIEKQVLLFSNNPENDFLYTNYYILKNNKKLLAIRKNQKTGYVFERFLFRYPVALVTAMLKRKTIVNSNIKFDRHLNLSEEHDLFMRFLYKSKAGYIEEPLAIYRIHSEMSSFVRMLDYYDEGVYILKKFKNIDGCKERYHKALKRYEMNLEYLKAKTFIIQGDFLSGRKQIDPYKLLHLKYFIVYLLSFLPTSVCQHIQNIIYKF